ACLGRGMSGAVGPDSPNSSKSRFGGGFSAPGIDWLLKKSRRSNTSAGSGGGDDSPKSAAGLLLQSLLDQAGLKNDESKQAYVSDVLLPLMVEPLFIPMLLQALVSVPSDPAIFILDWLVSHLGSLIPDHLAEGFKAWRNDNFVAGALRPQDGEDE
ncbi:unnamed protein product, partial [Polarella glacialis]